MANGIQALPVGALPGSRAGTSLQPAGYVGPTTSPYAPISPMGHGLGFFDFLNQFSRNFAGQGAKPLAPGAMPGPRLGLGSGPMDFVGPYLQHPRQPAFGSILSGLISGTGWGGPPHTPYYGGLSTTMGTPGVGQNASLAGSLGWGGLGGWANPSYTPPAMPNRAAPLAPAINPWGMSPRGSGLGY